MLRENALERALRLRFEAERVAAMGQLTGGVAPDFNNLLTVILGNIELAMQTMNAAERDALLNEAYHSAKRGGDLTAQLLSYSRKSNLAPMPLDLAEVLSEQTEFIRRVLPTSIEVKLELPSRLPNIRVDKSKFETMLLNLALNARDAMQKGGKVVFSARQVRDRDWVDIEVLDNGSGIPKDVLTKVMEPYFTTKPVGKGTGLGLSMAQGFVEQSRGALSIQSNLGLGTVVAIGLPAHRIQPLGITQDEQEPGPLAKNTKEEPAGGNDLF